MDAEYAKQVADVIENFHLPRYRELPDIGLHLEQVVRYVNRYVPIPLTASMVSNYVKQKLIPGPEKKSYHPNSIAYLIFLSYIKSVMSLEDIRLMMYIQKDSYSLEVAYDYFCDEFENLLKYVCGLRQEPADVGSTHTEQKELLRTALLSITYKIYLDENLRLFRAAKERAER